MAIEVTEREIKVSFINIDGVEMTFVDFEELMNELYGTDGFGSRIVMNENIAKVLMNRGIIKRTTRGSYYAVSDEKVSEFLNYAREYASRRLKS